MKNQKNDYNASNMTNSSFGNQEIIKKRSAGTTFTVSVVVFLLISFLLVTVISQLVTRFYNPLRYETAFFYEDTESVLFQGVYIRNERKEISEGFAGYANRGAVAYTNKCGSKLAIDTIVAIVYSSEEEIYTKMKIAEIQEQIDTLSEAGMFSSTDASGESVQDNAQIEAFSGQLTDVHLRILRSIGDCDYGNAVTYKNEYLGLRSKINVIRGGASEGGMFEQRIAELQAQVLALENKLSGSSGILWEQQLKKPGYFVSNADGYEDVLDFESAAGITREQINNIIANPSLPVDGNVVGKVIDDYKWRMAAVVNTDDVRGVSQGAVVKLRIGAYPSPISAQIISSVNQGDGETVLVFECELLNEEFVKKRVVSVRLLLDDYSGIRLPQSAVTFNENGERGVYVKNGMELSFRRINMLRSEEDFIIVENIDVPGFLRIFDEVVVSGRNLYDGRIVS